MPSRSSGANPSLTPDLAARRNARVILNRLKKLYPAIGTALEYHDPWQLLVATVLSAQTTDENVNRVTPTLFERWPTADDLAEANPEEVEKVIFSTGFYRQKTRSIIALATDVVERFNGVVPADLDSLVTLRGVGRKTASVLLVEAWGLPAIAVDTHVKRLSNLLAFTNEKTPEKVERDLMALFPEERWTLLAHLLIFHGRQVCIARRPKCEACVMSHLCPSSRV